MKTILLSLLFLLVPKLIISQVITDNDDAVYLDSLYNVGNEKNYKYIRVVKDYKTPNKESYEVKDFYKSGKIAMTGATTTGIGMTKTGMFVYFYENGNRKSITNYVKNKMYGNYYELYEEGTKKLDGEYIEGKEKNTTELKINQFWNSKNVQTVIDGNGDYEENNDFLLASGKIKNGFKKGVWEGRNKKIGYTFIESYENQKLVSGVSIDSDKVEHKYNAIETRPTPKNGMNDFYNFIGKNYKTPNYQGLKGKVYLTFVVEKDGKIVEPKVLRDLGYGTGLEAIRVVMLYNGFVPGEQRGIKTRCTFSLPISIQSAY